MTTEVLSFAKKIGAFDIKTALSSTEFKGLFKQRNYFLLDNNKYLIIKISRNKTKPFFGVGKPIIEFLDLMTQSNGMFYLIALDSENSGWILSKNQIKIQIQNGSLSYSEQQKQYKINSHNLKDKDYFRTPEDFLRKLVNLH